MLYTIIPYELIFEKRDDINGDFIEKIIDKKHLLLQKINEDNYKIVRLISTDVNDYLNPKYLPGTILNIM